MRWKMALGALDGKPVEVTIQRERKKRSLSQNSYYHGVVVKMLADAAGYEPDEMHDALRWEFLRVHGEERLPSVRSTTELSTVEFEDYLSKCRMLGAQVYGVYVPGPGE
jgi:hypothetical protein